MYQAVFDGDYAKALARANFIIAHDYVDLEAHRFAAIACKHLNNTSGFEMEKAIAVGLMRSIMTGDGLATNTPYTVISMAEEYQLLHAFGLQVTK